MMSNRNLKHSLRSTLASLALASSLTGVVAACSADTPTVTQVPSTISAQVPETAAPVAEGLSFYYDGVKTSVSSKDAAVLFAACSLNTGDAAKIVSFVNTTLKAGPITAGDVTGLGDPLKPAISDFNGNGVVNCEDAAILFAVSTVGVDAAKVNTFVSGTLKISGVTVTQAQLDSFFKAPATPTPTPTPTPASLIVVSPTSIPNATASSVKTINVKLAQDPSGIKTVTVTGPTGWSISPTSLNFDSSNFNKDQPVQFTAPLTAVGQTQNITFSGTGLGSVDVPVTVTPVPNTFFLDPVNGSDNNSGTAAAPWKTFEGVLKVGVKPYQSELVPLLQKGENVTIQVVAPAPVTQTLTASLATTVPVPGGSITIVGPTNYKLSIPAGNTLTLNENVKLEGFSIVVNGNNGIVINKSTASINNATIRCKPPGGATCINVNAANVKLSGNKITFDVKTTAVLIQGAGVTIKDSEFRSDGLDNSGGSFTAAIKTNAAGTTVLNSTFNLSSVINNAGANLRAIDSYAPGTTVLDSKFDFSSATTGGGFAALAISLNAGSGNAVVKGNKILVAGDNPNSFGVAVAPPTTGHLIQDNEFKASVNNVGIGIKLQPGVTFADFVNDISNGNSFPKPPSLFKDVQ
jgi:hypothetical protein